MEKLEILDELTNAELQNIYSIPIKYAEKSLDGSS